MKKAAFLLAVVLLLAAFIPSCAGAEQSCNWYEVFVRSYQDSDGDGIGDIRGLTERLDYIADMGYDGLWLMPVMPSPSYHKYDVTDYFGVDEEYGTAEDLKELISQAHGRGIRVILDLPVNHTSDRHPWFLAAAAALRAGESSPYTGYYHFRRDPAQGFIPLSGTDWYYEERFAGGGMPDLDLENEEVLGEIRKILRFWLQDIGADGFRLDAVTSYFTGDHEKNIRFLSWLKESCEELKAGSFLVGECWTGLETIARYYESGVDCFFLFPASQAEGFVAASLRGRSGRAEKFAKAYQNVLTRIPDGLLAPFLSNHDTGRTIGSVQGRGNPAAAKFAEGVLQMLGGCVFTYYGEEIGMTGSGDDPNKRLAMYWANGEMTSQPPGVTNLEYAYPPLSAQQDDPASLWSYCRAASRARKACPAIARGENEFLHVKGDVCLMKRTDGEDAVLIALNFSAKDAQACPVPQGWSVAYDLETGDAAAVLSDGELSLPPYSIVILTAGGPEDTTI